MILKDGLEIVSRAVVPLGTGTIGPQKVFEQALSDAGLTRQALSRVLVTGLDDSPLTMPDSQKSEISCHAVGVHRLLPTVRTVVEHRRTGYQSAAF